MTQIATKFVKWDIPELATLQDSKGLQIAGTPEQRRQVKPGRKELDYP